MAVVPGGKVRAFVILSTNLAGREGMLAENGLSVFVRYDDSDYLFDTGGGSLFAENAEFMNVPLSSLECAVLSHIHPDHIGGVPTLSQIYSMISKSCDVYHTEEIISPRLPALKFIPLTESKKISDTLALVVTGSEVEGSMIHEISMLVGDVLFAACCHAGIEKILAEAQKFGSVKEIVGGFHNFKSSENELKKCAASLAGNGIERICFLHCSNLLAVRFFEDAGIECRIGAVGRSYQIS